jgi:hypothetical protein
VDQQCVECRTTPDCTTAGDLCIDNICQPGCTVNDECPAFFNCVAGECVEATCIDDRECIFSDNDLLSVCVGGACRVPCESDAQCTGLQVCEGGGCVYVGCTTDAQCRYELNTYQQNNLFTGDPAWLPPLVGRCVPPTATP